jgi:pimeloyl-ACP methyl ester carboxylesterase
MTTAYSDPTVDTTQSVISQDGAKICYLSMGSGPAVLVIPGALSVAADYTAFGRALAEHFTVHIIERRGRGGSSPQGADYSIQKECEDARAVLTATGASLLVGHSFGGLVALEVARKNPTCAKVAVYEPGVSINGSIPMNWMPAYQERLAHQDNLGAFVEFTRGVGPESARHLPRWCMRLLLPLIVKKHERTRRFALLQQNLLEHREVARHDSSYQNYREVTAEVLLMYGGKSGSKWASLGAQKLAEVLPRSEIKQFPRLNHFGIDQQNPREVAETVSAFFLK